MSLTPNEIRKRAMEFSKEWQDESREKAEAQTFWNEFFNIFGITRRRIASYEAPVKKLREKSGAIDLFWKSVLIVEHKSKGKILIKPIHRHWIISPVFWRVSYQNTFLCQILKDFDFMI
jgi:hypothetical protein